jgi:hypothetical protein
MDSSVPARDSEPTAESYWEMAPYDGVVPTCIVLAMYLFGLFLEDRLRSWPWVGGGVVVIVTVGALLGRPERIGISEGVVYEQRGRRLRTIPLDQIDSVDLTWAPKTSVYLVIRSESTAIEVRILSNRSAQFRRRLGQVMPERLRERSMSDKLAQVLFLDA